MKTAVIGGTGFYAMVEGEFEEMDVSTRFGAAKMYWGKGKFEDIFFIPRHGIEHTIPPHKINYRANLLGLKQMGVEAILATFAVGSISERCQPGGIVALEQFLDFTDGREATYYDGGEDGLVHVEVNDPYCKVLRKRLLGLAPAYGLEIEDGGVYVATNGPRFETPAEIKMYEMVGGDVVGMTGVPEVVLARELELHYAAAAHSINWAAGIQEKIEIVREGVEETRKQLLKLFVKVLGETAFEDKCECKDARMVSHSPEWWGEW